MIFWGWVALLLLLALLWVGYALLRIAPDATNYQESRVARNVALYRTRLAASEGDLAEEMVTPEEHAALANELARQLLADVDSLGRSRVCTRICDHLWGTARSMPLTRRSHWTLMAPW